MEARHTPTTRFRPAVVVPVVLAALAVVGGLWFALGSNTERWWNDDRTVLYVDTYRIATGDQTHRTMYFYDDAGQPQFETEGPMTASGKPHGHWTTLHYRLGTTSHDWFYYGEEVSEAEFHTRTK